MRMYYDDDDDDDPYAPRIGLAAMPSPRSKFAPYFSGCTDMLEDFLEEYEGLAYDCVLTDPQRVDVIIRYVAPSLRDFWRSLNGYFHAGHLTEDDRNAAFWYRFHLEDRKVLQPRLLGKNPFQPPDIPFHFDIVFSCARAAFAYDNYLPSPWSQKLKFEPSSVRREQPVVEPIPRDSYSFRAVTRAVVSNAQTTTTPNDFPLPSHSTPFTQLPPSSSPSVLESQHGLVHSVTLDQPELAHTLSTTLPPSDSPPSHTPSLAYSATDNDPISAPTFPITTSTLPPSVSPTLSHDSLLAHLAADVHKIPSTSLPTLAPFSMPISSDFEYLPSATVDQPASTLSSTSPSASPTSSTCLPSVTEEQPEPEPEPIPLITPASTFASTPLPSSSSTFLPTPVISATDCQPTSEPESMSVSVISTKLELSPRALPFPPDQKLDLPPRTLSLPPDQMLAPISSSTLSSSPLPEISTLDSTLVAPSPEQPSSLSGSLSHLSRPRELESSSPALAPSDVVTLSHPEASLSSLGETIPLPLAQHEASVTVPTPRHSTPPQRPPGLETFDSDSSPLEIPLAPANLAPSHSTFALLPVLPASSDFPSASASPSLVLGDLELESFPTPSPAVDIIPLSQPESSWSPVYEPVLLLPAPLEPIQCRSTLPQRPPGLKSVDSDSSSLKVAPALALSTPQLGWKPPHVYEVQSIKPPALAPRPSLFHSSPSLRLFGTSIRFGFTLALVTTAVLASILNIPATVSTFAHKYWSKQCCAAMHAANRNARSHLREGLYTLWSYPDHLRKSDEYRRLQYRVFTHA
ncbi:hypothetical protein EDB83DRAFT_2584756 [Lactarius deliciosus]|nr:hypothetical protein EDB83DRAFT_2584756 [Lactarius deliciosus]